MTSHGHRSRGTRPFTAAGDASLSSSGSAGVPVGVLESKGEHSVTVRWLQGRRQASRGALREGELLVRTEHLVDDLSPQFSNPIALRAGLVSACIERRGFDEAVELDGRPREPARETFDGTARYSTRTFRSQDVAASHRHRNGTSFQSPTRTRARGSSAYSQKRRSPLGRAGSSGREGCGPCSQQPRGRCRARTRRTSSSRTGSPRRDRDSVVFRVPVLPTRRVDHGVAPDERVRCSVAAPHRLAVAAQEDWAYIATLARTLSVQSPGWPAPLLPTLPRRRHRLEDPSPQVRTDRPLDFARTCDDADSSCRCNPRVACHLRLERAPAGVRKLYEGDVSLHVEAVSSHLAAIQQRAVSRRRPRPLGLPTHARPRSVPCRRRPMKMLAVA